MNDLTPAFVRALSLVSAAGITALIFAVHAADIATLGAPNIAAAGASPLARTDTTVAQPRARIALAGRSAR